MDMAILTCVVAPVLLVGAYIGYHKMHSPPPANQEENAVEEYEPPSTDEQQVALDNDDQPVDNDDPYILIIPVISQILCASYFVWSSQMYYSGKSMDGFGSTTLMAIVSMLIVYFWDWCESMFWRVFSN